LIFRTLLTGAQNNESAKALETNIQEKRTTVALLETEREAFLRELMVIRERLDVSKDGYDKILPLPNSGVG
jgi:hypothetical protein